VSTSQLHTNAETDLRAGVFPFALLLEEAAAIFAALSAALLLVRGVIAGAPMLLGRSFGFPS